MQKCSYCNSLIIFGGVRDRDLHFCDATCRQDGALLTVAQLIPEVQVKKQVAAIHEGLCPLCQSIGPIDVHTSYSIWAALVVTTWKSSPQVSCLSCGNKAKIKATLSSFFLGWWSFPAGLILTPIQITKNLWGLVHSQPSFKPSAQLEKIVRLDMAAELQRAQSPDVI